MNNKNCIVVDILRATHEDAYIVRCSLVLGGRAILVKDHKATLLEIRRRKDEVELNDYKELLKAEFKDDLINMVRGL